MTYEKQKKQILQAAESVVHRFGFAKTTMNDIARAMRKGKSSLYHYFSSKEEIFVELLRKEIAELKEEFLRAIESEPTPERKIRTYILTRMRIFRMMLDQHMSFIAAIAERYELLAKIHKEYDPDEIKVISGILEKGVADGRFAIEDIPSVSMAIVYALKGFEYPLEQRGEEEDFQKRLDLTLKILFHGIVPCKEQTQGGDP